MPSRNDTTTNCTIPSPIGNLCISGSGKGLQKVKFTKNVASFPLPNNLKTTVCQLNEYFAGSRKQFDVPLFFEGNDFQLKIWTELLSLPYGNMISYRQFSKQLGYPDKTGAIASAIAANPIMIIVPCHRVIGASGQVSGYAGGHRKKEWLLKHEQGMKQTILF